MDNSKNMKILILFFIFFLTACASTPVPFEKATPIPKDRIYFQPGVTNQNSATSIFIRDKGIQGNMVYAHLFINGVHAAAFDVGERAVFSLKPGEYIFTLKPTDPFGMTISDSISQKLDVGKDYLYRVFFDGNSWRIQRVHPEIHNNP